MHNLDPFSADRLTPASTFCRRLRTTTVLLGTLLTAYAVAEPAEPRQAAGEITAAAVQFVRLSAPGSGDRLIVTPVFLDPRLNLARCDRPLDAFVRPGTEFSGRVVVGVRCTGKVSWKVYLPVHVGVLQPAVVTTRPLARDQVITENDIEIVDRDVSGLTNGYIDQRKQVIGRRVARSVGPGIVLQPRLLQEQTLIEKGQAVTLSVQSDSVSIQMAGIAQTKGAENQLIQVRNLTSGKIVEGRVRSDNLVEIAMN